MKLSKKVVGLWVANGLVAGLLMASEAQAAGWSDSKWYQDYETAGNDYYSAGFTWNGMRHSRADAAPITVPGAEPQAAGSSSTSFQAFFVDAKLFGSQYRPLLVNVDANARGGMVGSQFTYAHSESVRILFDGQVVFDRAYVGVGCSGKEASYGCWTHEATLTKQLASKSESWKIIDFPAPAPDVEVTVTAKLYTTLRAGVTVEDYASNVTEPTGGARTTLPLGSVVSRAKTVMFGDASLWARTTASVGLTYVAEVEAGADLTLLGVNVSPTVESRTFANINPTVVGGYTGVHGWSVLQPVQLRTLNGRVYAKVELLGEKVWGKELVSWNGFTWNGVFTNDSNNVYH